MDCSSYAKSKKCCNCAGTLVDWGKECKRKPNYGIQSFRDKHADNITRPIMEALGASSDDILEAGNVICSAVRKRSLPDNFKFTRLNAMSRSPGILQLASETVWAATFLVEFFFFAESAGLLEEALNLLTCDSSLNALSDAAIVRSLATLRYTIQLLATKLMNKRKGLSVTGAAGGTFQKKQTYGGNHPKALIVQLGNIYIDSIMRGAATVGFLPEPGKEACVTGLSEIIEAGTCDDNCESLTRYIGSLFYDRTNTDDVMNAVYDSNTKKVNWLNLFLLAHGRYIERDVINEGQGFTFLLLGSNQRDLKMVDLHSSVEKVDPPFECFRFRSGNNVVDFVHILRVAFLDADENSELVKDKTFDYNFSTSTNFSTEVTLESVREQIGGMTVPERLQCERDPRCRNLLKELVVCLDSASNEQAEKDGNSAAAILMAKM